MENKNKKNDQLENIKGLANFDNAKLSPFIIRLRETKQKLIEMQYKIAEKKNAIAEKLALEAEKAEQALAAERKLEEDAKNLAANEEKVAEEKLSVEETKPEVEVALKSEIEIEIKNDVAEGEKIETEAKTLASNESAETKEESTVAPSVAPKTNEYVKRDVNAGRTPYNRNAGTDNRQSGGYQNRPNNPSGAGYQSRPANGTQNSYPNRPNNNGYQNRPNNGYQNNGYQNRPNNGYQNRNQIGNRDSSSQWNTQRQTGAARKPIGSGSALKQIPLTELQKQKEKEALKKKTEKQALEKKNVFNKKTLIKKGFVDTKFSIEDDDYVKHFKKRGKKDSYGNSAMTIEHAIITTENVPIKVLSEKIGKTAAEIIKKLFILGITKTINESIDFETAQLIADELGVSLELQLDKTFEDKIHDLVEEDKDENLTARPPVVAIMGHVDHGKTSLLDYIRKTGVAQGEAGGITQHIGAYTISIKGQQITFLDTPGHEAFTSMRKRGANATDIAVIVVAADDGIMPQTIEAINHAKQANVSLIVAVNKIDKVGADFNKVKEQLPNYDVVPDDWGGDAAVVPVSAKTGKGVEDLLETILTVSELRELKANPDRMAQGVIIESRLDKGRGPVATVLVQNGTLNISDFVVAGTTIGKVRAMIDDKGKSVKTAGPSMPVSVLGFSDVPQAGEILVAVTDEKLAKQVAEERKNKEKDRVNSSAAARSYDDIQKIMDESEMRVLNVIIKADVQGSVEAIRYSLMKLSDELAEESVRINVISGGVGAVNESDVMLADTADALVVAFNVKPDNNARTYADKNGIKVKSYSIIYDLLDDVTATMKGMFKQKFSENVMGHAEVRSVIKIPGAMIAGSMVLDGKVQRNAKARIKRADETIYEGAITSLKRFKDDAKEVAAGYECGIGIQGFNDFKESDVIEVFEMVEDKHE